MFEWPLLLASGQVVIADAGGEPAETVRADPGPCLVRILANSDRPAIGRCACTTPCHRRNPGAATVRAALAIAEHAVRGSRTALRRALTALVHNAISHTPAGGHLTRVWPGRTRAG